MRWFVFSWLFLMADLSAQESIRVRTYDVDQGLPMNTTWDVAQDQYGFLWVSTADGLSRFDGYTFHNHRISSLDSSAIRGQAWHSLAFDSAGNMWVAHENGIDRYDINSGKFKSMYVLPKPLTLELNKVIGMDANQNIYVWIIGEGLVKFNSITGQKIDVFSPSKNGQHKMVRDGIFIDQSKIWLAQSEVKIIEFDTENEVFRDINLPPNWQANTLHVVHDSVVLVGTLRGILRFNRFSQKYSTTEFNSIVDAELLAPMVATSILKFSKQQFWVGTNKGLLLYNDSLRVFTKHFKSLSPTDQTLIIQKLFKDKSGNIWMATNGNGLKRYAPKAPQWKIYRADAEQNDIVKSIYSNDEKVYVGYFQRGMDAFNRNGSLIKTYSKKDGLPSDNVYVIKALSKDELFLGFLSAPVNSFGVLNTATGKFSNLFSKIQKAIPGHLPASSHFPSAVFDNEGNLFFTYQYHLLKLDTNREVTIVQSFSEILNIIFADANGQLWMGTMNGLYHQTSDDTWKKLGDIDKQVKTIEHSADGNLWIGTVGGLYITNSRGELIHEYHTGPELVNDCIYGILKDANNDMWFSHNRGLTRYSYQSKTFKHFSVADGLQASEFNTGAFFRSSTGELFFGGVKGTNSFYPQNIYTNRELPEVRITKIEVNDKIYESNAVPWVTKEVVLAYPQNTVTLEFAGLEFTEPLKNQYRWRLQNVDNLWIEAGDKRITRYANLTPGEYLFEVMASNNDGIWNEKKTALRIIVLPPWWGTWWFKLLVVVSSVALIAFVAYQVSRQRYRRKISKLIIQQKIQKDRDRISRDLHDNVGSMVSFVSTKVDWLLRNNNLSHETSQSLQQIKSNASAIMAGLRETIWAISDKPITNTDLADKLKVYLKTQLLMPSVVSDDIQFENIVLRDTALNIYRSCQEIINNINKHSQATQVSITFSDKESDFEISILDNGVGISTEDFSKEGHYGLKNIRERLQQANASLIIDTGTTGTKITITTNSAKSLLSKKP